MTNSTPRCRPNRTQHLPITERPPLPPRAFNVAHVTNKEAQDIFSLKNSRGIPYYAAHYLNNMVEQNRTDAPFMEKLQQHFSLQKDKFDFAAKLLGLIDDFEVTEREKGSAPLFWFQMDPKDLAPYFEALKIFPSYRNDKETYSLFLKSLVKEPGLRKELKELINSILK